MASAIYPIYKDQAQQGAVNVISGNIKAVLIDGDTYASASSDDFLSDLTGVEETSANLTNKSLSDGTFDADDVTFSSTSGNDCEIVVLYVDTGTAGTSTLIAYLDSGSISGLPVTLGGDVTITWDASGIFTL